MKTKKPIIKTERSLLFIRPLPALLLVSAVMGLCPFNALAQFSDLDYRSYISSGLYCRSCSPETNIGPAVQVSIYRDFTTNASWNLFGQTCAVQQDTHIQGLHYYGSGTVTVGTSPENADNYANGVSLVSFFGSAAAPARFCFTGQCTRVGGNPTYGKPQFILQDTTSGDLINLQDAGATNVTGLVHGNFVFHAAASVGTFGGTSAASTYSFDLQFYTLPAGSNQILGELLTGGGVRFTYVGLAGTNYVLDRTFNLAPPINWVPQLTNTADASGVLLFTNTPNPATNNFWRVRSVP